MRVALIALLCSTPTQEPPPSYVTAPMLNDQEVTDTPAESRESARLVAEEGPATPSQTTPFAKAMALAVEIDAHIANVYPKCDTVVRQRLAVEFALAGEGRYTDWCRVIHGESAGTWDPAIRGDGVSSFGLFQINRPAHKNSFDFNLLSRGDALGVWYQIRCAIKIRKGSGWGAWTVARNLGIR